MVDPAEAKRGGESATGSEVLQALLDRDDPIWQGAAIERDMHRSEKSENLRDDKVLAGTSESGAEIIARSEYFTRREYREVFENLGTPYISSHKEWQTTDRIKGLKLEVVTAQDKSQRSVSLFLPDGLAPAGTYQHPLEIVLRTRFGVKTVKPDEADFKKLEDEIVYYLGDDVQWRAPSMEE